MNVCNRYRNHHHTGGLVSRPSYLYNENPFIEKNVIIVLKTGGRLNKKDGLTRYGDSHVKDKTS